MKPTWFVVLLVTMYSLCYGQASVARRGSRNPPRMSLTERNWRTDAEVSLKTLPPSQQSIEEFVKSNIGDNAEVCSWMFADTNQDLLFELIVSIDYSGRHFCNTVNVVRRNGATFDPIEMDAWNVEDVSSILSDLNNDGTQEFVVQESWADYGPTGWVTTWPNIYQWQAGKLVNARESFRGFYEHRLEELREKIEAAGGSLRSVHQQSEQPVESDPQAASRQFISDAMEFDKISRFLGRSPTAGFDRAQEWINSDDRWVREKAVHVFADIGDSPSLAALDSLARDKDSVIATSAVTARESIQILEKKDR